MMFPFELKRERDKYAIGLTLGQISLVKRKKIRFKGIIYDD